VIGRDRDADEEFEDVDELDKEEDNLSEGSE
jgi:hypothetical protein